MLSPYLPNDKASPSLFHGLLEQQKPAITIHQNSIFSSPACVPPVPNWKNPLNLPALEKAFTGLK